MDDYTQQQYLDQPCLVCGQGWLLQQSETFTFDDRVTGQKLRIEGMLFSVCTHCCAEPVIAEQARYNDKLIEDARQSPF